MWESCCCFPARNRPKEGWNASGKKIYPSWLPCTLYRRNNIGHYLPSGSLTHIGLLLLHRLVGAITFLWIDIVVVLDAVLVKRGGYIGVGGGKKKIEILFFSVKTGSWSGSRLVERGCCWWFVDEIPRSYSGKLPPFFSFLVVLFPRFLFWTADRFALILRQVIELYIRIRVRSCGLTRSSTFFFENPLRLSSIYSPTRHL